MHWEQYVQNCVEINYFWHFPQNNTLTSLCLSAAAQDDIMEEGS